MKSTFFFLLCAWGLRAQGVGLPPSRPLECDVSLLNHFQIASFRAPTPTQNSICPFAKSSCCDANAQMSIYLRWAKETERRYILKTFKAFIKAFQKTFEVFKKVEELAQKTRISTSSSPQSECHLLSSAVTNTTASALEAQVTASARKAFKFLYDSHKGMYCSLCDAELQKFVDRQKGTITMNYSFCSAFVGSSLNFYLFKNVHFVKIARLYAQYLQSCSVSGEYLKNRFVSSRILLSTQEKFANDLFLCRANAKTPEAVKFCERVCLRFHPLKFDADLEGELGKLFSYLKFIRQLVNKKLMGTGSSFDKSGLALSPRGRTLQEKNPSNPKDGNNPAGAKKPEDPKNPKTSGAKAVAPKPAPYIELNKQFGLSLITPVTYRFMFDGGVAFDLNYDRPLIANSAGQAVDAMKFQMKIAKEGINFAFAGRGAMLNEKTFATMAQAAKPGSKNTPVDLKKPAGAKPEPLKAQSLKAEAKADKKSAKKLK